MAEQPDMTPFEFTVDLRCEARGHEGGDKVKAVRFVVMSCQRCHHGGTVAVCGNCYIITMRARAQDQLTRTLMACARCGAMHIPVQFTQFYDINYLGRVSP